MARDRLRPDPDRLAIARLSSIARRYARWGELTEGEAPAGAAELREIVGGRADLLAKAAGTGLGFYEGQPLLEDRARAEARLLIAAGADETLIPQWAEEGRRRAEARRMPPFSQPRRTPPRP
jgi:hypothetical protein